MTERRKRPVDFLLVEDNPGDVRLMREAFEETLPHARLHVVRDAEDAANFLYGRPPHANAARPDLILLDLNIPRMDGRHLLAEIKQDANLRRIPVIVLTTSGAEQDVQRAYDLHANCYVIKPLQVDQLYELVRSIETFWLGAATLPRH